MKAMSGCRCLYKGKEGSPSSAQRSAWSGTSNQYPFVLLDCKAEQEHLGSCFMLPGQPQQTQPAAPGLKGERDINST